MKALHGTQPTVSLRAAFWSWFAGVNWPQIAAFLAAVYSLFLIAEKLYTWWKRAAQRRREGRGV